MAEWTKETSEILSTLRRYATVGNGTALVLALSSVPKAIEAGWTPSKSVMWLFFAGLLLSIIHLLFYFFWRLTSESQDVAKKSENTLLRARAAGIDVDDIERDLADLKKINVNTDVLSAMRHMQEAALIVSFLCLITGIALVIYTYPSLPLTKSG